MGRDSGVGGVSIGFERSDDFLRRTGPSPEAGKSAGWRSGKRDKSAISHGFVRLGAVWRVDIHGSWSNAWSGGLTRVLALGDARRRFGCCKLALERFLGQDRQVVGGGVMRDSENCIGDLRRCRDMELDDNDGESEDQMCAASRRGRIGAGLYMRRMQ
jgi:hypothetical protein